jgi:hypothetical protein
MKSSMKGQEKGELLIQVTASFFRFDAFSM